MTRNIGTFTAAGVSLEDSATAIKGISNLAAGVGSTPQQAANAMYQLSQALASGTVNLQDWNSVVNAGMGGQYFQNALKETARELAKAKGIAVKEFQGTFRESIAGNAKGTPWLTSEVLLETLKKFANDPSLMEAATRVKTFTQLIDTMKESVGSGWTETWEYVIGDLDEASDFFTAISKGFDKIIGSSSDARNEMMKFWHDNGGRALLIKALATGFKNLSMAMKPIKRAFNAAFPPIGKERLVGMTEGLLNFMSALKLTDPQLEFLRNASDRAFGALKILLNTFKGVSKVVKIVGGKQIPEAFSFLIGIASKAEAGLHSFIGVLEHFLGIDLHIPTMKDFEDFGNFINNTLDAAKRKFAESKTAVSNFYASLADGKVKQFTDRQSEALRNFLSNATIADLKKDFEGAITSAKEFFQQFDIHIPTLSDFWNLIDRVATAVWNLGEKFQNAGTKVANFFMSVFPPSRKKFGIGESVSNEMGEMAENAEEGAERTKTAFDYLIGAIDFVLDVAGHIVKRFVDIFHPVWDALLDGFSEVIKDTKDLSILDILKIATVFMSNNMYGAITKVMDSIGGLGSAISDIGESIGGMVEGAKGVFEGLQDTLSDFTKEINSHAIINIAIAVAILAGSVIALSMIDVEAGLNALMSISLLVGEMLGAMSLLSKVAMTAGKLTINIGPIIMIAVSVAVLAAALAKLASLEPDKLQMGLKGVTALVIEMAGVAVLLGRFGKAFGKGMTSLIVMAFAVSKLGKVIATLGSVELGTLLRGGAAVGAIMAALIALSYSLWAAPVQKLTSLGAGLILLATGIKILTGSVAALANLDNESLLKGGAALGVMVAGIIALSYALWAAPVAKLPVVGLGLVVIAAGMTALATAAFLFSRFSWTSLAKAGAAFGGILAAVIGASYLVRPLNLLALAGALTVLSVALFGIAVDFKILSSMGLEGLLVSLGALVGVFVLMGGAGALLAPLIPTILSLAGALTLYGLGIGLLGVGALALSTGLAALGPGLVVAAVSVGAALGMFLAGVMEGLAEILNALALLGGALAKAFIAIGLALVEAIVTLAGPIATGINVLLIVLLATATEYMDPLIDKIINFLDKFLNRLLDQVLPSLGDWVWRIVVKVADLLLLAIEGLVGLIPGIGQAWRQGIQNVRETISEYWDDVIDTRQAKRKSERQMEMLEEGLVDASGKVNIAGAATNAGQEYVNDFLGALRDGKGDISDEAGNISGIMTSIRRDTGDTSGRSGSFGDAVDEAKRSVDGFSGSVGSFDKKNTEAKKNLQDLRTSVKDTTDAFTDNAAVAQDVINGKYGNGEKRRNALIEAGYDPDEIQKAVNAILSGDYQVETSVESVDESVESLGDKLSNFSKNISQSSENADGFSGRMNDIFDSVSRTDGTVQGFSETLGTFSVSMDKASDSSSEFTDSFKRMSDELSGKLGSFDVGQDFVSGYLNGILSRNGLVLDAVDGMGNQSVDALAESIDAHSPSRKTTNLALMFGAGYIDNIQNLARPAYAAGYGLGEESVDGLADAFSMMNGLDSLYAFSPTITPILDLSDVDSGMAYLQNEFAVRPSFGVNSTWMPDIRNAEALLSLERPDTDINRIIDEMGYLRDDIVRMGEEISRMKVYLDEEALVGQMAGSMDEALGQSTRRSIRSGRR